MACRPIGPFASWGACAHRHTSGPSGARDRASGREPSGGVSFRPVPVGLASRFWGTSTRSSKRRSRERGLSLLRCSGLRGVVSSLVFRDQRHIATSHSLRAAPAATQAEQAMVTMPWTCRHAARDFGARGDRRGEGASEEIVGRWGQRRGDRVAAGKLHHTGWSHVAGWQLQRIVSTAEQPGFPGPPAFQPQQSARPWHRARGVALPKRNMTAA